jgi:AraC-like DNA-binding protein
MEDMIDYAAQRDRVNRSELKDRIAAAIKSDGFIEPFEGVRLTRIATRAEDILGDTKPAVCFIAQGAKEVHLGEQRYRYDPEHYLLATVEIPVRGVVVTASNSMPYLGLRVELDPALVGSVMVEAGLVATQYATDAKALCVSRVNSDLLDAATRLVRLLETPKEAKMLIPQAKREIVLRLLVGEQGHRLRQLPAPGGQTQRIARALERLRQDFDRPLSIEELAKELGMSSTRFHHHFKAVTDMSPLQFQKQLRLQEARRLMLGEDLDAASAAYRVGYEDAAHFNREYKRFFGLPPMRDVGQLRKTARASVEN